MRTIFVVLILCLTAGLLPAMTATGPQLEEKLLRVQNNESVEIMIVMNDQSDEEYPPGKTLCRNRGTKEAFSPHAERGFSAS
jgi:hypothetical protein